MFTSDPIYFKPYKPRITIKALDNSSTLYTYDPWTDAGTTDKPIYCTVQPQSPNHQGTFTVQWEDSTLATPDDLNLRVIIECGKQSTQMTRLISGLVRQAGKTRGADGKILTTVSGSSTGIRLNERITYAVKEAAKLTQDGITLDPTDATMKADALLQAYVGIGTYPTTEAIDTSAIAVNSDVENFVPSISVEYGELQDVANLIQEASDGEVFVDVNDTVRLRHALQPAIAGRGFTIKNKKVSNDNADDTMYLRGKSWDYTASISKADSYSNYLYGILPPDSAPIEDTAVGGSVGNVQSSTNMVAQKFRPRHTTWRRDDFFWAGQAHNNATAEADCGPVFCIAGPDTANTPNSLNILYYMVPDKSAFHLPVSTTSQAGIVQSFAILNNAALRTDLFELDTTKDYWMVMADYNSSATGTGKYFQWFKRSTSTGTISTHSSGGFIVPGTTSTLGTGWASPSTGLMWFATPRQRSVAYQAWDPKAIIAMQGGTLRAGLVQSTLSALPSYIKTKEAMYKYMATQLYYMARPRYNFNFPAVTAPNIPPLPGDPILIQDSQLSFLSNSGQRAFMATCGDMTYSWGNMGSGGYQAPTILSINAVAQHTTYIAN